MSTATNVEVTAIKLQTTTTKRRAQGGIPPSLIFFGVVVCLGCGWLGQQVAGPLQQAARLHGENDAIEREVRKRDIRNQEARKQADAILTEEGIVAAARARGFTFKHERPLRIQSESATAATGH